MELEFTTTQERFSVFEILTSACSHHFSKGKPQDDRIISALQSMYGLTHKDPIFLAHLAAWAMGHDSKDFKRAAVYMNALSSGDGTPFVTGGSERKPNLRQVSHALLPGFDPKEIARIAYLRTLRWNNGTAEANHFPGSLKRAIGRYLDCMSEKEIQRSVSAGFTRHFKRIYNLIQYPPSDTMVRLLKWNQRDGRRVEKKAFKNPFDGLTDRQIVNRIKKNEMSFSYISSLLPRLPSPNVLAALASVASPNQLIVKLKTYEESGLLSDQEFSEYFYAKISEAQNVDRIDTLSEGAAVEVKEELSKVRAAGRRKSFGHLDGKLWLDIDCSVSMEGAIETAKEHAATICEVVGANNFEWSLVGEHVRSPISVKPETKEQAMSALFGVVAQDRRSALLSNYVAVQGGGSPVDYWWSITDGQINYGLADIAHLPKPKVFVITHLGVQDRRLGNILEAAGVLVYYMPLDAMTESALVASAIKTAIQGPMQIVDEIMATPLPMNIPGVN